MTSGARRLRIREEEEEEKEEQENSSMSPDNDNRNRNERDHRNTLTPNDPDDEGYVEEEEEEKEDVASMTSSVSPSQDRRREKANNKNQSKKRRDRLRRELAELQEQQRTFFPNDPLYELLHATQDMTEMSNRKNHKDDEEEDDIDDPEDHDYDEVANVVPGSHEEDGDENEEEEEEDFYDEDGNPFFPSRGRRRDEEEEEEEGEDLLENIYEDYQAIPTLDTYDMEGIDNREYNDLGLEDRIKVDEQLDERDAQEMRGRGGRSSFFGRSGKFYESLYTAEEDVDARIARRGQFRSKTDDVIGDAMARDEDAFDEDDDRDEDNQDGKEPDVDEEQLFETEEQINLEAFDVPLKEWIAKDRTRREVIRKFRLFLIHFTEEDEENDEERQQEELNMPQARAAKRRRKRRNITPLYEDRIRNMCASNLATLEVSYHHLMMKEPIIARWIQDNPRDMLDLLNEAATRQTLKWFPSYRAIQDEVFVRISEIPITDSLRSLRRSHLDKLVKVNGVVTRRSSVYPQIKTAYYECTICKTTVGPFRVDETLTSGASSSGDDGTGASKDNAALHQPSYCSVCENNTPFRIHTKKTEYRNYQRINLQETPGSVPAGRVPRTKEVILCNDLIDTARPGEEIEVIGVFSHSYDYQLTQKSGFPVFSTFIIANHIQRKEDASATSNLTEADKSEIFELARDPKIGDRIVDSIAPSIYGHKHVKMALAMSLFGAVPKNIGDKHRIRGDINVLLLGDPGTAKSQLLKYAESTAPRAVYTTGKGASAVGLTASVHKDPVTREWTLEGGALVLADRGVCLIDEFDKMNEQDRTSIHEAMEQQSISISKAGIVTSLQARCAVIAAANPIGGRYDSSHTFSENVELTDPILQRFDILCVLQDTVDPIADENLAKFVTGSHMRSVPTCEVVRGYTLQPELISDTNADLIPQNLLRKYIQYARTNVKPILRSNAIDQEKISSLYVALRRESLTSGGVPIAVRHIESIMRMAEAHAKMHLREYVREDDVDASISMILSSFITAQKFSVRRQLQRNFAKYLSSGEDRAHLLLYILQDLFRNEAIYQATKLKRRQQGVEYLGTLEVALDEFEGKARDRRIYDVSEFCKGRKFREAGYTLDERRGIIYRDHASM